MKVGIISMQRVYNYGSFMQSYALKKIIESLGHDCVFIDIKPGMQIVSTTKKQNRMVSILKKCDRYALKRIAHIWLIKKHKNDFPRALFRELGISSINTDEYCDVVVIGSDEVFNCTQPGKPFGYSSHLFGQNVNAKKVISYAASFGYTTIERLDKYHISEEIGEYLKDFKALSVRDKNSFEIVKKLSGIIPQVHMDPVIVGDFDDRVQTPSMHNYLAIYAYSNRINDKKEIDAIRKFAHQHHLKIIGVGMYQVWCDENVMGEPFEIVGYIKNADYVVTDTFHGCVFSIKYKKKFAAFVRDSNRNKLIDLLSKFELQDRLVTDAKELATILNRDPDADKIEKTIELEKGRTIKYFKDNIL